MNKVKTIAKVVLVCSSMMLFGCVSSGDTQPKPKQQEQIQMPGIDVMQELMQKADIMYQTRDYEQAGNMYKKVLDVDPKNIKALYRLGNIAFRSRDWDSAKKYYDQVIEIEPRHTRAQYNLAMTYLTMAERHLKFYAAHVDSNANLDSVTKLITALEDISNPGATRQQSQQPIYQETPSSESSLDKLLDELAK